MRAFFLILTGLAVFFNGYAQESGITLEKVLALTMQKQSDILIRRLGIDAAQGVRLSSASAFDTVFKASLSREDKETPILPYQETTYGVSKAESEQRKLSLSASKMLRSGVTVSTELSANETDDKTYGTPNDSERLAAVSLSVPWYDITEGSSAAMREKSAVENQKSALYSYYHQITAGVYGTMSAWWSYLAAYELMVIYNNAKESTHKYLEDYKKLVERDERPRADLIQLEAKYQYALMEANAAESRFRTAGYALCSAIGISYDGSLFENPDVKWPDFDRIFSMMPAASESFSDRRFDIKAAEFSLQSSKTAINALKRDEKPEINLSLSFLRTEKAETSPIGSFSDSNSGSSVFSSLSFSLPMENSYAKGQLMQQYAAYGQSKIRLEELKRQADIDVNTAWTQLNYAYKSLKIADETVKLYEQAYATERKKQSLGMSTVLDVVATGDSYRNALIERMNYVYGAADAAAKFAYVSGSILTRESEEASVNRIYLP